MLARTLRCSVSAVYIDRATACAAFAAVNQHPAVPGNSLGPPDSSSRYLGGGPWDALGKRAARVGSPVMEF